jgi:hypothetical protein
MEDSQPATAVDHLKFLGCLMRPAKNFCCKGCALRVMVIVCLIIDFVLGVLTLFKFIDSVGMYAAYKIPGWYTLAWTVTHLMNFACLIAAGFGACGINQLDPVKMNYYCKYKHIEMFVNPLTQLFIYICLCNEYPELEDDDDEDVFYCDAV